MDINAVSRALHALNVIYQRAEFYRGVAHGLNFTPDHYRMYRPKAMRLAMVQQTIALIEHDRILTGRDTAISSRS